MVQGDYTELNAKSFVSRMADSDQGTGSTGYREVFDKAQAVRTQS
jgi:hypothetical protein